MTISGLRKWGRRGWQWAINWSEPWADGMKRSYRTNGHGEGLWVFNAERGEWRQTVGTCQFALPGDRRAARRAIRQSFRRASNPL